MKEAGAETREPVKARARRDSERTGRAGIVDKDDFEKSR